MRPSALTLAISALVAATTTSAQQTTTAPSLSDAADITALLYLNSSYPNTGYVASVISANPCNTTAYVLGCAQTDSPNPLCLTLPNVAITVTARPTNYDFLFTSARGPAGGTVTQSCDFEGPSPYFTRAVCSLSGWIGVGGRRAEITSTIETIESSGLPTVETIPITAGADNTATNCAATPLSPTPSTPTIVAPSTVGMESSNNAGIGSGADGLVEKLLGVGAVVMAILSC